MPTTVFLDMNETLLNLSALDPLFASAFGDAGARKQWFGLLLQLALTHTVLGDYRDFSTLGREALHALGEARAQPVPDDLPQQVAATMQALPLHPDTLQGLSILKAGGARLYALTNNRQEVLDAQVASAGLGDLLDGAVSVDPGRVLKPGRGAYEYGLNVVGAAAADTWLLAAHGWDISGARSAGLRTAFVERPGQAQNPLCRADVAGPLLVVAQALLQSAGRLHDA
ncbi:2-haloacid dehalogenase [Deinococcus metalli]|uniref:Haloacid dehalogenase n=1 Tax=Deinococcus metalli TaxID=1141878 RepID=A0A7W8KJD8_9DEIO|nr:haloacid dehalogenase type II [Deinococcus metalli]MBB5379232.1 2-haloacid dehalogenase [Deinococcus metalli]GHF65585.1 haloacid dehalogenase [Deinococcus metalli]